MTGTTRTLVRAVAVLVVTVPFAVALFNLGLVVAGTPPEHAAIRPDAVPVTYGASSPLIGFMGRIDPTTSLAHARCQAWLQTHDDSCPDPTTLAVTFWPDLSQEAHVIYVGTRCDTSAAHFNVDYSRAG